MSTTELPTKDDILNPDKYVKLSFKDASDILNKVESLPVYLLIVEDNVVHKQNIRKFDDDSIETSPRSFIYNEGWELMGKFSGEGSGFYIEMALALELAPALAKKAEAKKKAEEEAKKAEEEAKKAEEEAKKKAEEEAKKKAEEEDPATRNPMHAGRRKSIKKKNIKKKSIKKRTIKKKSTKKRTIKKKNVKRK